MQIKKISLILLTSSTVYADISLYDGAYRRQDIDAQKFVRFYSSRRLERGHLGVGWCNALDNRIVIKKNHAALYDCINALPLEFTRVGRKYTAFNKEELRQKNSQWERWQANAHIETYDRNGKITELKMADDLWKIKYTPERIFLKAQKNSSEIEITLHQETKFIQSLLFDKNEQVYFDYDQGYLVATRTKKQRLHSYVTSSSGDILKAMDGSLARDIVFYDEKTDRVLQVEKTNGCTFGVNYQTAQPSVTHLCPRHLATNK